MARQNADREGMKSVLIMLTLFCFQAFASSVGVKGTVASPKECGPKVMVWLSLDKENYKERLLLMHTEVPVGGSYQFFLKPGDYQVRASDEKGCEFFKRIKVEKVIAHIDVKMEKK